MRNGSRPISATAAPIFAALCLTLGANGPLDAAEPKEIIAAQVRTQGFPCEKPIGAERDQKRSTPDQPVWVLRCENATYRVKMIPDMRAQIDRLE